MAMPSDNKSSCSSAASNPNPRSSEINNPMRRSFSTNPFSKPSVIVNPRSSLPNTPVNSPSDFPRRNSVDDKENAKDQILKPSTVRSPAAPSKGTKNFMSPTISASSKITESPRKKVLVERNEPARTSIPSNDGKSPIRKVVTFAEPLECVDSKPHVGAEEKRLETLLDLDEEMQGSSLTCENLRSGETVHDMNMNVPLISRNDIEEPDCVNLDPTFKLSPTPPPVSSTATILAPLDADPLMPPYDPKTNYLSPRPQFLHYKPKPRIGMELCNEGELEDSFISGSLSDTEVTEDTQSDGSQKESEDVSSNDMVEEEVEGGVSEPSPCSATAGIFMPEETVEAKHVPKPQFSKRSKAIIALIFLLSIAFISIPVTNSPVIYHTVFEDFYEVYKLSDFSDFAKANFDRLSELAKGNFDGLANFDRLSEFAKANFDGLARNFHIWFTKSLSSISELISNVRGVHDLAHLQYYNLTVSHEYIVASQYPIFGHGEKEIGDTPEGEPPVLNVQESDTASRIGTEENIEDISSEFYDSVYEEQVQQDMGVITGVENASNAPDTASRIGTDEDIEHISAEHHDPVYEEQVQLDKGVITGVENASDAPESEEIIEGQPASVTESELALQLAGAENLEAKRAQENWLCLDSEVAEIHIEVNDDKTGDQKAEGKSVSIDEAEENWPGSDSEVAEIHAEVYDDEAVGKSVSIDAAIKENEQRLEATDLPPHMVLYLLLCGGAVLITGTAFNWSMKGKSRSKRVTSSVEQPLSGGKASHAPKEKTRQDKPSLWNGPIEMDVVGLGESCPSETSSFQQSSPYSKNVVKELNEVHSLKKKKPNKNYRRESLASSTDCSMGSPSYGSLTVYEKIPSKHGHGDEETITPVRRSSRIRNQATSPL